MVFLPCCRLVFFERGGPRERGGGDADVGGRLMVGGRGGRTKPGKGEPEASYLSRYLFLCLSLSASLSISLPVSFCIIRLGEIELTRRPVSKVSTLALTLWQARTTEKDAPVHKDRSAGHTTAPATITSKYRHRQHHRQLSHFFFGSERLTRAPLEPPSPPPASTLPLPRKAGETPRPPPPCRESYHWAPKRRFDRKE